MVRLPLPPWRVAETHRILAGNDHVRLGASMKIVAKLLAGAMLALPGAAFAQASGNGQVGVLADPCAALPPLPAVVTDYMVAAGKARADKQQPPPIPPEVRSAYEAWTTTRLTEDFAGRCTWREANAKLPPASGRRVVFFGDSITQNWQGLDPSLFSDQVLDRGVSGQTTAQMVIRFQDDVIALHPAVVHIMAGVNDIAGNTGPTREDWIEANIRTMVELAQAHGVRVVLSSLLPAAKFDWRPGLTPATQIREMNERLRRYAHAKGLIYVDYYPAMAGPHGEMRPQFTEDGVHPNAKGYAVMRPIAEAALRRALAEPEPAR